MTGVWVWKPDESPGLAPAPPPVEEREYEVVGPRAVLGHRPGDKFKATLELGSEALLIESGHIQRVGKARKAGGR